MKFEARTACPVNKGRRLGKTKGYGNEENISTEQAQARPQSRVSQTHVHQGRAHGDQPASGQGKEAVGRLIQRRLSGWGAVSLPEEDRAVRFFLKKADRILKRSDYVELSRVGRRVYSGVFIAVVAPNRVGRPRLGITVTRKVGGAVQRNRIKRLVREVFRLHRERLKLDGDINVIARIGSAELANQELRRAIEELFEKVPRQIGG